MPDRLDVLTIGHSNHSIERFAELLQADGCRTVVDVRTTPFSRFQPQFSSRAFSAAVEARGLGYAWLGKELGGRPAAAHLYAPDGSADYVAMAREPSFHAGIGEVIELSRGGPVCLVCSERKPEECHRCLMVGRGLVQKGLSLGHIHFDGRVETHTAFEDRLLGLAGVRHGDLFAASGDSLARAYISQTQKIAFRKRDSISGLKGMPLNHEAERERGNGDLDPPEPAPGW